MAKTINYFKHGKKFSALSFIEKSKRIRNDCLMVQGLDSSDYLGTGRFFFLLN